MKGKQNAYSLQQNKKFVLDKGYSLKQQQKERRKSEEREDLKQKEKR